MWLHALAGSEDWSIKLTAGGGRMPWVVPGQIIRDTVASTIKGLPFLRMYSRGRPSSMCKALCFGYRSEESHRREKCFGGLSKKPKAKLRGRQGHQLRSYPTPVQPSGSHPLESWWNAPEIEVDRDSRSPPEIDRGHCRPTLPQSRQKFQIWSRFKFDPAGKRPQLGRC